MAASFTDDSFQTDVLDSTIPVLVDFWAPWCGPCRQLAPTIDALSEEYAGRVSVGKMNTDESPKIATQFGIQSIPTLIIFKNGEVADRLVGALPKAQIAAKLDVVLNS